MKATIKKTRIALALLFLPREMRTLAKALIHLGTTFQQIAETTKVLEIARAVEEIKRRREAAAKEEIQNGSIH